MSRFGSIGTFYYDPSGTISGSGGTSIVLDQSQMPQYPFQEYRINDKVEYRNLNGDLYTYQNYNKAGYIFTWSLLDETATGSLRRMFDANPALKWTSNGTMLGTFYIVGSPTIDEVQFELYDIELEIQER